jgi:uncharacterized delta-60 repeat protein
LDLNIGNGLFINTIAAATAISIQKDGKLIISGCVQATSNIYDFSVVRLNINGTFDTAFGSGGKVSTDFKEFNSGISSNDQAFSASIQNDGKIVLVGASGSNFALARYNP